MRRGSCRLVCCVCVFGLVGWCFILCACAVSGRLDDCVTVAVTCLVPVSVMSLCLSFACVCNEPVSFMSLCHVSCAPDCLEPWSVQVWAMYCLVTFYFVSVSVCCP